MGPLGTCQWRDGNKQQQPETRPACSFWEAEGAADKRHVSYHGFLSSRRPSWVSAFVCIKEAAMDMEELSPCSSSLGGRSLHGFMNEVAGWSQDWTSSSISYCLVSAKQSLISKGKLRSFCMSLLTWCLSVIPISANGVIGSPQCELPIMHPRNLIWECKSH